MEELRNILFIFDLLSLKLRQLMHSLKTIYTIKDLKSHKNNLGKVFPKVAQKNEKIEHNMVKIHLKNLNSKNNSKMSKKRPQSLPSL